MSVREILVTGASGVLGRAIAVRLARDGNDIVVHYGSNAEAANETAAQVRQQGQNARLICFDVADRDVCRRALDQDVETNGIYYGIVLNAGIIRDTAFPAMMDEEWDQVLGTNLDSFYNVLHPVVMPMVSARKGGRIVVMSSASGLIGNRGQVNYSATKAGLIGAAKALAVELAKRKITVNCVAPALIESAMLDDLPRDEIRKNIPMRRFGTPEEVAGAVAFFCSSDAAYITRQVLSVNGGMF